MTFSMTNSGLQLESLKRFMQLAGPDFLDIPWERWSGLLGMTEGAYHRLFEDLVTFGRVELPRSVGAATRALEAVYRVFTTSVPDRPDIQCMDLLAGVPEGDTIASEAARRGAVFSINGGPALTLIGFLEANQPGVGGKPYSFERLLQLEGMLWYLEWHLASRDSYLSERANLPTEG